MRIITRITPPGAKKKQKEKPPLRVAAYCRVSTEHPEQETSLDLQVRYYTQRIESTPGWVNAGVFAEKASGLSIKRRKEFQRLLDSYRNGEIDMVLVKPVSQFGRDSLEMFKILRELQALGWMPFSKKKGFAAGIVTCSIISRSTVPSRKRRARTQAGISAGASSTASWTEPLAMRSLSALDIKGIRMVRFVPMSRTPPSYAGCLRCGPPAPASVLYQTGCTNRASLPREEKSAGAEKPSRSCSRMKNTSGV